MQSKVVPSIAILGKSMLLLDKALELARVFGEKSVRHADSFVNSLPYYLLTSRNKAQIYTNGHSHVVTAHHPHQNGTIMIFPEIGDGASLTADILTGFAHKPETVMLARYTMKDLEKLQQGLAAKVESPDITFTRIEDHSLDWIYPSHIIDTKTTSEMQGGEFEKLRNKFNKVVNTVSIEPLSSPTATRSIKAALHFWIGSLIATGDENAQDKMGFYECLINNIQKYPGLFDGFVVHNGCEPVGFTVWDVVMDDTANSLASLSRRSIKGLSEFQIVTACRKLNEQGIGFYNMGGSETKNLDLHKLKFRPTESVEMASYQINCKRPAYRVIDLE
ncbi:MAG: hypothetical protein DI551_06585 [Micavibrio aeruginosavorus]|uniref:Phosphatidylglycerol lysyltransferase C-terminal domain-containing protein n=1 Tax=Micavibrio aeruginosavorus TaxID=349221 RepID=A0A2W5MX13_9BACT|nr:MAG: hypothetical protein DI551_06585 [Micavibrio aeruginosavorus]